MTTKIFVFLSALPTHLCAEALRCTGIERAESSQYGIFPRAATCHPPTGGEIIVPTSQASIEDTTTLFVSTTHPQR